MIYKLIDLIGDASVQSSNGARWVRSVPLPFYGGYLSAAWAVLRGRAVAVRYPKDGELEDALFISGGMHVGKVTEYLDLSPRPPKFETVGSSGTLRPARVVECLPSLSRLDFPRVRVPGDSQA